MQHVYYILTLFGFIQVRDGHNIEARETGRNTHSSPRCS